MSSTDRIALLERGLRELHLAADHGVDLAFYAQHAEDPDAKASALRQVASPEFLQPLRDLLATLEIRQTALRASLPDQQ